MYIQCTCTLNIVCNYVFNFRSPFIRTPKTSKTEIPSKLTENEESAVGLNELEGAVLLDAEDYRRMLQEVKTLKSILLRLKRELTADVSSISLHTLLYMYM